MRVATRRVSGLVLLAAIGLFATVFQWLGPGLFTTHRPAPPRALAQGPVVAQITSYHLALTPLVVFGIAAVVVVLLPDRADGRSAAMRPPLLGVLSVFLALFGVAFGRLAPYAPGGAGVLAVLMTLSTCSIALVLGTGGLLRMERHLWVSGLGLALSVVGSWHYFAGS